MSRSARAAIVRPHFAAFVALSVLALRSAAQEPLFTFVQVSDSQPQSSADNRAFTDVLGVIAAAGRPGALLPRPVDLVLFAGDITFGNTRSEWVAARQKLDAYLTANDIPFLAVPGNHDVDGSDTDLYEEFIADSGVWDAGSAAFTGHNARTRSTGWQGLRFIGVDNSNPGWNTIPAADVADVGVRVAAADSLGENVLLVCHHPHNEKSRMPLAAVLRNPSVVGYLHGHTGSPRVKKGLTSVVNPLVWDVDTNAIYQDRALVYFEVYPTQLRAHVVVLDANPSSLPAGVSIPLAHPLSPVFSEPSHGFADGVHSLARATPTSRSSERKLWHRAGEWWGVLWSDAAGAYRIQRLDALAQRWIDTGPAVSTTAARSFDVVAAADSVTIASNVPTIPAQAANGSPGQVSRFTFSAELGRYALDAGYPVPLNDSRSPTLVLARDGLGTLWAAWTRGGSVLVAHSLGSDAAWSTPLALTGGLGDEDTVALASLTGSVGALWSSANTGTLHFARHADGAASELWASEVVASPASMAGEAFDLVATGERALAAVRTGSGALKLLERSASGAWNATLLAGAAEGLHDPVLVVDRAFGLLRLFATGPTLAGQSVSGGGALYTKISPLAEIAFPPGRGTPVVQDGAHPSGSFATSTRQPVDATSGLLVLGSVTQTERYWHARDSLTARPLAPVAEFSCGPLAGPAPLTVAFTDLSSGAPTHWSWNFGDGSSSAEHEPEHVYARSGVYTITLRVASGAGLDARTRTALVHVTEPPPVRTFRAVADARVSQSSPSQKAGSDPLLRIRQSSGASVHSYLRFDLAGLSGSVVSAKLRLYCTDGSDVAGRVFPTSGAWTEASLSWSNKPAASGPLLASAGAVAENAWVEFDVTAALNGAGELDLVLQSSSSNSCYYSSREGAHPPELVVTTTANPANLRSVPERAMPE